MLLFYHVNNWLVAYNILIFRLTLQMCCVSGCLQKIYFLDNFIPKSAVFLVVYSAHFAKKNNSLISHIDKFEYL